MKTETILYPVVDPEVWAKTYGISIRSNPCVNCGKELTPTKPYAHGDWRGLMSEPHGCKSDYDFSIVTKATKKGRAELMEYFSMVRDAMS